MHEHTPDVDVCAKTRRCASGSGSSGSGGLSGGSTHVPLLLVHGIVSPHVKSSLNSVSCMFGVTTTLSYPALRLVHHQSRAAVAMGAILNSFNQQLPVRRTPMRVPTASSRTR